jgi:hypothetical protein
LIYVWASKGAAGSFDWGTAVSVGVGGKAVKVGVSVAGGLVCVGAISGAGASGCGALHVDSHNTRTNTTNVTRFMLFSFSPVRLYSDNLKLEDGTLESSSLILLEYYF